MKPARIALMGGMGYPLTETAAGMPTLQNRFLATGAEVLLVSWDARQQVYNFMHGFKGFRAYLGDSLGGGSAGQYPGDVKTDVDFAGAFQPSDYDARSHNHVQTISGNILRAHCIYDPYWIDTAGLGHTHWVEAAGSKTKLLITEHRGAHPDDWGYSQDLMFNEVKGLMQ